MQRNFKLIGGFGIAEKEIKQRQVDIKNIIDKYYNVGIREFFIGYNPPYWHETFGFEFSPNGRFGENEQITSYETFKQAIEYVHTLKDDKGLPCEIFLAANFRYYSDITMPYIKKIIDEALEAGVDGIISGSPEVIQYLADVGFKGKVNISTILSIYNEDAINFLVEDFQEKGLNLNRMILPREVTLNEIKYLAEKFPNISFEVFGHGDYCRYANGLCLAEHKYFSRDICGFVIKHGLETKKTIRYEFKKLILDENISNEEKQALIDNSLNDLENIFVSQNVVDSNIKNETITYYINQFENNFFEIGSKEEINEIADKIYELMNKELLLNFAKYIYDGLRPSTDLHNWFIDSFLTLHKLILPFIIVNEKLEKNIEKIKNIRKETIKFFEQKKKEKGTFGLETYYKFMLYNRTSVPFYRFFNDIPNIEVVKIPLRGRDVSVLQLGLDMINDALENPGKYIDQGSLSGKYFHYDPSKLDIYKEKFN